MIINYSIWNTAIVTNATTRATATIGATISATFRSSRISAVYIGL